MSLPLTLAQSAILMISCPLTAQEESICWRRDDTPTSFLVIALGYYRCQVFNIWVGTHQREGFMSLEPTTGSRKGMCPDDVITISFKQALGQRSRFTIRTIHQQ